MNVDSKDVDFAAELAAVLERHVRPKFEEERRERMAVALVWADPQDSDCFQLVLSREMTDDLLDRTIKSSRDYAPTPVRPKPGP